ncbi:hypothetical protein AX17_001040 [Amanita inopinata Kibby_2008]|nr:hypothetical protein AX17_001040 [Amanita inopinata Kibby_2008]
MDADTHPLKVLLQLYLANDASAAANLPYILGQLTEDYFLPSPHLTKWITRINSLLLSKEACGRWAGLCLAYQTSEYTKSAMMENAQGWLAVALPLLSKNESIPVQKASVRLLCKIFSGAMDIPEFQRQISIPNVPKMTNAMISLAEKSVDTAFNVFIFTTLSKLVSLYPTVHRASSSALSSLALSYLNGNALSRTNAALIAAASKFYVVLHLTGGKVGAANLWRKSVAETVSFCWDAFFALRTTFPSEVVGKQLNTGDDSSPINVSLNLDRLGCCVVVLRDFLSAATHRPVHLPLGSLVKLSMTLLTCSRENQIEGHVDPSIRALEVLAVPEIWKSGCDILEYLASCARHLLTPNLTKFVTCLTIHLEQKPKGTLRLACLRALRSLVLDCHPLDSGFAVDRLTKVILPLISSVLLDVQPTKFNDQSNDQSSHKKRGKKRGRSYEGDEILRNSRKVVCQTAEDSQSLWIALEVFRCILQNHNLSGPLQSISIRTLIAVHMTLPRLPQFTSNDFSFHARLCHIVQSIIMDIGTGTTSSFSDCLGLIIGVGCEEEMQHHLDLLLHPRVPPLVRSLPHVQSLALSYDEESQEEANIRRRLGLTTMKNLAELSEQDVPKHNPKPSANSPVLEKAQSLPVVTPNPAVASRIRFRENVNEAAQIDLDRPIENTHGGQDALVTSSGKIPTCLGTAGTDRNTVSMPREEEEEMPSIDMASDTDDSEI